MSRLSLLVELVSPFVAPDVPTMAALQAFVAADGLEVDTSPMWRLALLDGPAALLSCLPMYLGRPMPVDIFARFVEPEDLKGCSADAFARVAGRMRDARPDFLMQINPLYGSRKDVEDDDELWHQWQAQVEDDAFDWRRLAEVSGDVALGRAADPYRKYLDEKLPANRGSTRRLPTSDSLRHEVHPIAQRDRGYVSLCKLHVSQRWILGHLRQFYSDGLPRLLDELETLQFLLAHTRYLDIHSRALAAAGPAANWYRGDFSRRTYEAVWSAESRARDRAIAEYVAARGPEGLPHRAAWVHEARESAKARKAAEEERQELHRAREAEQRKGKEERDAKKKAARYQERVEVVERFRPALPASPGFRFGSVADPADRGAAREPEVRAPGICRVARVRVLERGTVFRPKGAPHRSP